MAYYIHVYVHVYVYSRQRDETTFVRVLDRPRTYWRDVESLGHGVCVTAAVIFVRSTGRPSSARPASATADVPIRSCAKSAAINMSSSSSALQVYREGGGGGGAAAKPYVPSLAERVACVKIDALPYIDGEYNDPRIKAQVLALVHEEMGRFAPPDYLKDLKLAEYRRPAEEGGGDGAAGMSELLAEEFRRMERGERLQPLTATVDPPPKSLEGDVGAWHAALLNAKTQLAHQDNRTLNLELLAKYGASVWQDTLKHSEALSSTCVVSVRGVCVCVCVCVRVCVGAYVCACACVRGVRTSTCTRVRACAFDRAAKPPWQGGRRVTT